jgi:hypothetical protein
MPMDKTTVIALEGLYQYIITIIIHWVITSDNILILSRRLRNFYLSQDALTYGNEHVSFLKHSQIKKKIANRDSFASTCLSVCPQVKTRRTAARIFITYVTGQRGLLSSVDPAKFRLKSICLLQCSLHLYTSVYAGVPSTTLNIYRSEMCLGLKL